MLTASQLEDITAQLRNHALTNLGMTLEQFNNHCENNLHALWEQYYDQKQVTRGWTQWAAVKLTWEQFSNGQPNAPPFPIAQPRQGRPREQNQGQQSMPHRNFQASNSPFGQTYQNQGQNLPQSSFQASTPRFGQTHQTQSQFGAGPSGNNNLVTPPSMFGQPSGFQQNDTAFFQQRNLPIQNFGGFGSAMTSQAQQANAAAGPSSAASQAPNVAGPSQPSLTTIDEKEPAKLQSQSESPASKDPKDISVVKTGPSNDMDNDGNGLELTVEHYKKYLTGCPGGFPEHLLDKNGNTLSGPLNKSLNAHNEKIRDQAQVSDSVQEQDWAEEMENLAPYEEMADFIIKTERIQRPVIDEVTGELILLGVYLDRVKLRAVNRFFGIVCNHYNQDGDFPEDVPEHICKELGWKYPVASKQVKEQEHGNSETSESAPKLSIKGKEPVRDNESDDQDAQQVVEQSKEGDEKIEEEGGDEEVSS